MSHQRAKNVATLYGNLLRDAFRQVLPVPAHAHRQLVAALVTEPGGQLAIAPEPPPTIDSVVEKRMQEDDVQASLALIRETALGCAGDDVIAIATTVTSAVQTEVANLNLRIVGKPALTAFFRSVVEIYQRPDTDQQHARRVERVIELIETTVQTHAKPGVDSGPGRITTDQTLHRVCELAESLAARASFEGE